MALQYTVRHAFYQGGVLYTRENEADVKGLPRDVRDGLIERGRITETDDRGAPDAPAAPAPRTDKEK